MKKNKNDTTTRYIANRAFCGLRKFSANYQHRKYIKHTYKIKFKVSNFVFIEIYEKKTESK